VLDLVKFCRSKLGIIAEDKSNKPGVNFVFHLYEHKEVYWNIKNINLEMYLVFIKGVKEKFQQS